MVLAAYGLRRYQLIVVVPGRQNSEREPDCRRVASGSPSTGFTATLRIIDLFS
jgi:hypothetical protein